MNKGRLLAFIVISSVLSLGPTARAQDGGFEYPCYLVDAHDADDSCWAGMDAYGNYQGSVRVVP